MCVKLSGGVLTNPKQGERMNLDKVLELPKPEIAKRLERVAASAASSRKNAKESSSHLGRALVRKAGTVEGVVEVGLVARYLAPQHPTAAKVVHGSSAGAKSILGIVADYMGFEGLAGALDTAASTNVGVLAHQWGEQGARKAAAEKKAKEASNGGGNAASSAPGTPPRAADSKGLESGELWAGNRLSTSGDEGEGETSGRRPLRHLVQRDGRIANAIRNVLRSNGFPDSDANVGAVVDSVDEFMSEGVEIDPNTGEMLETGAGLGIFALLKALQASTQAMNNLSPTADPPKSGALDDSELLVAQTLGIVDPEDANHIITSGLDDGLYLSTRGNSLSADDVRAEINANLEGMGTGAFGDGFRAMKDRIQYRRQQAEKRRQARIASDKKRLVAKEKAKELKQGTKLAKKEGEQARKTQAQQQTYDQQVSANDAAMKEVTNQASSDATQTAPAETTDDDPWGSTYPS